MGRGRKRAYSPDEVLPRPVYQECVWIVKDKARLEEIVGKQTDMSNIAEGDYVLFEDNSLRPLPQEVIDNAAFRLRCIQAAIEDVPEEYREGVIDCIVSNGSYRDEAHENTWKRWKHRFIYSLAVRLALY